MIPENRGNCICNSTEFIEYYKTCQTLDCNVKYLQCKSCGMVTAPESKKYDLSRIYNDEYFNDVDYGWKGRAKIVCAYMQYINLFIHLKKMRICDFGAGNGYLSKLLVENEFDVFAYEPFRQKETYLDKAYFCDTVFDADILLMVEVFEHFTHALNEIDTIIKDFHDPKLIIFTTNLADNATDPINDWDYIDPDSGHFTIWSKESLRLLGKMNGYKFISLDNSFLHVFCKDSEIKAYNLLKIQSFPVKGAMKLRKLIKELFK